MTRICSTRGCRNEAIRDSNRCSECLRELLRDTRPEWLRRSLARDLTGAIR